MLQRNRAQGKYLNNNVFLFVFFMSVIKFFSLVFVAESEYFQTLRENPEIPYDANKEPPRGVLKPSPYSSPVNPFYKRKLHI